MIRPTDMSSDRIRLDGVFRQLVEAAPGAMMVIDCAGRVVMMNARAERMFGYQQSEALEQPIERLVPERWHGALRNAVFVDLRSGLLAPGHEFSACRKDGSEFPVELGLSQIDTSDGPMVLATILDMTERKREDARLRAALREKDVLLSEIHHRVKNNLQIVYSLLALQACRVEDPDMQDLLRDSQNRIHSMALIHQTLYGSQDFERVDFLLFIDTLLPVLTRSYGIDPARIRIRVDVERIRFPIDIALPCGLAANELITNALKHAFRDRERGEIRIALTRQLGNEALLSVSDNGVGLPDHVNIRRTDTIGLSLVGQLAAQLDGEIFVNRSDPTRISLRFAIR